MACPQTARPADAARRRRLAPGLSAGLSLALGSWLLASTPARAETPATAPPPSAVKVAPVQAAEALDQSLSPECRVPGSKLYTLAKLNAVKAALKEKRPIRVLSIGSSSAGLGTGSSYPVKLENALESALPDVQIEVEARSLPGEVASGAGERLRTIVAEVEPDLVVWQVGTNDALARVDIDTFAEALDESVKWVMSHDIDIVLIDPVFTASLAQDDYYNRMVGIVQEVARREAVPLVHRYAAMRFLSTRGNDEAHMLGRQFRLNDLGLRCMAEHATRAITLSLLQSDPVKPDPNAVPDRTGTATRPAPGREAAPVGGGN
ncbi:GDSL-type esterase/lipase family protein [Methylobacterium sp. Leaf456]|uniref:SGNH/GDSL hydrolase family protein n=1 Tax=Methylobacterium sp. Leaf456 TaxID=1736382 RepID=UPI0009EB15E7|nr:GDSL-type esterase/lipase family protein [Methylobacterium sp. Leaf456]